MRIILIALLFSSYLASGQTDTLEVSIKNIDSLGKATISSTIVNAVNSKQSTLVSGTNIKTINGSSVLGSGDLSISASASFASLTGIPSDNASLSSALNAKAPLISPSFTTPNIGAAAGISLTLTGDILSSGGGIGYTNGNGGTVTQTGNKGTTVTINKRCGVITTTNSALAAGAEVSFNVNNSTVALNDVVQVSLQGGGTAGSYGVFVTATGAGLFTVTISNLSTGSLSQALIINFIVLKAVNN